jgi:hypothetical protein
VQRRGVGDDDHGRALTSLVVGLRWPMALDRFPLGIEFVDGVFERYAVSLQHAVKRRARRDSEDLAQFVRRELTYAIGVDRERFERCRGRVLSRGSEALGEGFGKVHPDSHEASITIDSVTLKEKLRSGSSGRAEMFKGRS